MSIFGFLFDLFGSDSDDKETKRSKEHEGHGHHGDRRHSEGNEHHRGPSASDSVRHGAVEAESYSRKAEIKNETETVEGPKKIQKRRRDE